MPLSPAARHPLLRPVSVFQSPITVIGSLYQEIFLNILERSSKVWKLDREEEKAAQLLVEGF